MTPTMLRFDRRRFLATASALVAAGLLPHRVLALTGPKVVEVGGVKVTVLSDGTLNLPPQMLAPDADPAALQALLATAITGDTVELQATPAVFQDGARTVLVDMGGGAGFAPTTGKLSESLAEAGIAPEAITDVAFTHGHPDHLFGAMKDGALLLPNARYHVGETEWGFWTNPGIFDQLPAEMHDFARGAQAAFAPMQDKVTLLKQGDKITDNVTAVDAPGHTPGHVVFEIAGGDGAILCGDVIPSHLVHFAHPEWRMGFDAIPETAVATRRALLDRAAAEKKLLIGYHWSEPAGRAEAADGGFRFVAA